MKTLIVGLGSIGKKETDELPEHPHVDLVGVVDTDPARRHAVSPPCPVFSDMDVALKRTNPDLVRIATPPATHHELARRSLQEGADVYIEKIMTLTATDAREIVELADSVGQSVYVRRNAIYTPVYQRAWNRLSDIGEVRHIHWIEPVGEYTDWSEPKREWLKDLPGGIVSEHLPHALYTVRWFLGEEPTVEAVQYNGDELHAGLRAGEKRAQISYVKPTDLPMLLDITGSDGTFRVNHSTMRIEQPRGFEHASSVESRTALANIHDAFGTARNLMRLAQHYFRRELSLSPDPYYSQSDNWRQFTDIATGQTTGDFSISGREGLKNVELFEKIWAAAE